MSFAPGAADALPSLAVGFLVAALIAFAVTPVIRDFVRRRGIVDRPDPRRVHRRPLPRGGGVAVGIAFVLVGGALELTGVIPGVAAGARPIASSGIVGLFVGGIAAAAIGAFDDLLDLRARWQLLGQLIVAAIAVAFGIEIRFIDNPFAAGNLLFPDVIAIAITVLWIVGMINSINFIDGLDGLSSGIALIAAVTLGILSLTVAVGQPIVAVLCFVLAGGLLGFLRWNFHPAIVFQGTSGVMFLGFTLAALSILGTAKVVVALLVLGVPIIDSFWVIVRRISGGRSPFSPDRGHIHHRLLDLGLSHRSTVLLIYAICAALGAVSLLVSAAAGLYTFLAAAVAFGLVVFIAARQPREALEPTSYDNGDP
ncbi:MAG TPA: MraY family glycosyltransferase [Candidatus Limnocylindrales bacterium]|nr:MraY family glycosyltransferase [Candidatus Limnocylindrales bacterium]